MHDRSLGILKRIALAGFSILLTLVVAEFILRNTLVPVNERSVLAPGTLVSDDEIGYRLAPNARSRMTNGHFDVSIETDGNGLRDVFDTGLPTPGFIAIGDSQTFGHGVEAEDTWVEQLQRDLGVNVINTGVFGYGINQYEGLLRKLHEDDVSIRVVLYGMSWNDLESSTQPPDKNVAVDGQLRLNPQHLSEEGTGAFNWVIHVSNGFQWFVYRTSIGSLLRAGGIQMLGWAGRPAISGYDERTLAKYTYFTKRSLRSLNQYLNSIGARLFLVHLANPNLAMTDLWEDYRRRYPHSRFYVRESLADWAEVSGIAFADATEDLEQKYLKSGMERSSLILPVDNHYNAGGHEVIAQVFRDLLRNEGIYGGFDR
ncbi:GDSL-type esterase/lipase family protein [Myxococcota bacterium]|nr:GDSL-type esterase/lipase family protein [Myxococcota bacterium]